MNSPRSGTLLREDPPLFHLFEVDSTQKWLREKKKDVHLPHGTAVFADRQTAGRGRPGNAWVHQEGNLAMSVLMRGEPKESPFPWTLVVAQGILSLLEKTVGSGFGIKYPNDLYWMDPASKVGGILVEAMGDGDFLIGIGLNRHDPGLSGSGAITREGRPLPPDSLSLPRMVQEVLLRPSGRPESGSYLESHLLWKGCWVVWTTEGGPGMGKILGLDPTGRLRLLFADHSEGTLPLSVQGVRRIAP